MDLTIVVSGSDLLKHWRATHSLDMSSAILISGSDPLRQQRLTHSLYMFSCPCQWFQCKEQLTNWMHVQPLLLVVLICSKLESNSHTECMVSHSCQWFWFAQIQECNSHSECMFSHSHQWLWSAQNWRATHILNGYSAVLVNGSDLLKHSHPGCLFIQSPQSSQSAQSLKSDSHTEWEGVHSHQWFWSAQTLEATHILNACSTIFISGSDLLKNWSNSHSKFKFSHFCQ